MAPVRLFFDARYTRTRVHDGISRFSASLIEATACRADVTMLISDPDQLRLLPPDVPWLRISSPTSAAEPWVARQINPHRPDVVFSPMQTMGGWGREYPLILTLHDLIYYEHRTPPRNLPGPIRLGWRLYHLSPWPQRLVLDQADAVATVSQTTCDLMRSQRLTRRPIEVIPNAPQPVAAPRDPAQPPARRLVYMGSFMDYKNVEGVIRGLSELPEHTLHLCSPIDARRRAELTALAPREDQLVFHDGISESGYHDLLRDATALVTLSRAEGYGLPVIEAMSHGTPAVVSDLPIFREIAGTAWEAAGAQAVDPDDPQALAAAVRRLADPQTFAAASRAARRRSLEYGWEDSADRLLRVAGDVSRRWRRRRAPWG
nr:glycosyltransferase [Nesterenkonia xinjiangensis]